MPNNTFNDLEELRIFLQERFRAVVPDMEVGVGSDIDTAVISPLVSRLGPDPYNTPILEFILGRLRAEYPDLVIQDGDPEHDYIVNIMRILLEPFRRQIEQVSNNQSFYNPDILTDVEADKLGSNFFVRRKSGGSAVGIARLYFTAPQYIMVMPSNTVFTASGLRFYPVENQSITSENMLFNIEGSLYYFDVIVRSEEQGDQYNISANSLVGVDGLQAAVKVTNRVGFTEGAPRESTPEFISRVENSLTEKSLITLRGITARVAEIFESIRSLAVVGYGDVEMGRDILQGYGAFELHAKFVGEADGHEISLTGDISTGDGFISAGVNVGDKVSFIDVSSGDKWESLIDSVGVSLITDKECPKQSVGVMFDIQKPSGGLTISKIPGGILVPNTDRGEIEIKDNQVHIGGAVDVYVRAGFPQFRSTNLLAIRDAKPIHFGLDLESFGESDDEIINVSKRIEGAIRIPTTDKWGVGLTNYTHILVRVLDRDTVSEGTPEYSPWYPTEEDVGRLVQVYEDEDTCLGTFPVSGVPGYEITGNHIVRFGSTYTPAISSDLSKNVILSSSTVGELVAYNNDQKLWLVKTTDRIGNGSGLTLDGGTGAGTTSKDSMEECVVRVELDLSEEYDGYAPLTNLPVTDLESVFSELVRVRDFVSVRYRVRDRDNSRDPSGIDFGDLGAKVGDSVVVEIGSDAGIYSIRRILSSIDEGDTLLLDRELTGTVTPDGSGNFSGLRYRIADELDIDLVNPRTTKIPLGDIFSGEDLTSVAGSAIVNVMGGDTNFNLAGVETGDTLEVMGGGNGGKYQITEIRSGTSVSVSRPMVTTLGSQRFKVYRGFVGVSRPLVRVRDLELLDANANPTGTNIPYGDIVDARILGRLSNREQAVLVDSSRGNIDVGVSTVKITDPHVNFVNADIHPGYRLNILTGPNFGSYVIETVGTNEVTVVGSSSGGTEFKETESNVDYNIGLPSTGYLRLFFQEPTSVEIDTGLSGCKVTGPDDEEFFLSSVDGYGITPEEGSDETNLRDLRIVRSYPIGGNQFHTIVELSDAANPDAIDLELIEGDILNYHPHFQFMDSGGNVLRKSQISGPAAGLKTLAGSNKVRVPVNSLVDFEAMDAAYGLVGATIMIEEGPDAGEYRIEDVEDGKSLRISQVMVGTSTNQHPELSPRTSEIKIVGSDVVLEGDSNLGTQVGAYITIIESRFGGIEGTYEITAVNPVDHEVTLDAPNIQNPVPAGSFSWFRTSSDEEVSYRFNIYDMDSRECSILEVASKEPSVIGTKYSGTINTGDMLKLEDSSADFYSNGVRVGDRLEILYGSNAGVYPIHEVNSGFVKVAASHGFTIAQTSICYTISGGLHGPRTMLRLGPSGPDNGLVELGDSILYRIRRPSVARVGSTLMGESFDGALYYVDVTIESLGSGDGLNLEKDTRMGPVGGYRVDGYKYSVANNTLTFSPYEKVGVSLTRRFLPVGNTDVPQNRVEVSGRNLRVNYDHSVVAGLVNDLLRSEADRPACANPISRHFLPSYVYLSLEYEGGVSSDIVGKDLETLINGLGPDDPLSVSDITTVAARRGALSIRHPIELVSLTHDIDRNLVVDRSYNRIGGEFVPFNGTARISSYFARVGEGLNVERR